MRAVKKAAARMLWRFSLVLSRYSDPRSGARRGYGIDEGVECGVTDDDGVWVGVAVIVEVAVNVEKLEYV